MIQPSRHRLCLLLASFAIGWASIGAAEAILQVGTQADLLAELANAEAGTVIEIAPGDYGALKISDLAGTTDQPIILKGSDPANPPRFSSLDLRDVQHLRVLHLTFDYEWQPGEKIYHRPFQIIGSEDVTVSNTLFDGDLTVAATEQEPSPTGFALGISSSSGVIIADSEFRHFFRGIVTAQSNKITLRNNNLHSLRMDGLNFAETRDVVIEGNRIQNFDRVLNSADHADFIQFWTNQTKSPSENIIIRGNILNSGDGWYTQSIFMRNDQVDRGLAGREMFYRNVLIEDNVIINAHLHGISVGETDGLIIRNNSVIRNARSEGPDNNPNLWTPQIRVSPTATNVTITGNVVSKIEGFDDQPDWAVENNFFIQDRRPGDPGYYDEVFLGARTGDPTRLENFASLPGGPLDGSGLGSSILANLANDLAKPLPAIKVTPEESTPKGFAFDATLTRFPAHSDPASATYAWDMGDGTRLEGAKVTHGYATDGTYNVTLTLTLPGTEDVRAQATVTIPKSDVFALDPTTNALMAFSGDAPIAITHPSISGGILRLAPDDPRLTVPFDLIAPLYGAQDFRLSFRLQGSGDYRKFGEILHIPKTLVLSVTGRGALNVEATVSDGKVQNVKSPGERLYETTWRDIDLLFSGRQKTLSILIDGQPVAERPFDGFSPKGRWDMTFGNPKKGGDTFIGALSDLRLTVNIEGAGEQSHD